MNSELKKMFDDFIIYFHNHLINLHDEKLIKMASDLINKRHEVWNENDDPFNEAYEALVIAKIIQVQWLEDIFSEISENNYLKIHLKDMLEQAYTSLNYYVEAYWVKNICKEVNNELS